MGDRTVSEQVRTIAVPVPAATTTAAPFVLPWDIGNTTLNRLEIGFTRGASFLVGVHFLYAKTIIIPWNAGAAASSTTWVVGSDETVSIPVDVDVDGGLSIEAYNADPINFHTLFLRAYVVENSTLDTAGTVNTGGVIVSPESFTSEQSSSSSIADLAAGALDSLTLDVPVLA